MLLYNYVVVLLLCHCYCYYNISLLCNCHNVILLLFYLLSGQCDYVIATTKLITGANWLQSLFEPLAVTPYNPFDN